MSRAVQLQRRLPLLQLVALIALFLYGSATIVGFATVNSIRSMLVLAALLGLAAAGQTLVVIIGGLDLSVPGFIAMGAIVISELCGTHHWTFIPALAVIVFLAAAGGSGTGWVCHRYRINPLAITLGVSSLVLGGCLVWTKADLTGSAPNFLSNLVAPDGTTFGLGIAPIVVIWLGVTIAFAVFLHRTPAGRRLYATGANPRAAELALIRTRRVWVAVFAVSAIASALVGILLAGFSGPSQSIGDPYLFQGLTAVIVGGTVFAGSRGDYTHTAIGALILTELTTILVGHGYDQSDQQIFFGVLILLVVAGYGRDQRLRDGI